jgi:hypothetical protein
VHTPSVELEPSQWIPRFNAARFVRLADIGIKGNSHMLILEKNNLVVATAAATWLRALVDM